MGEGKEESYEDSKRGEIQCNIGNGDPGREERGREEKRWQRAERRGRKGERRAER
jgi:hypothetical protein